jgi:hypothetical protein
VLEEKYKFYLDETDRQGAIEFSVLDWSVDSGKERQIGGFSVPVQRLIMQDNTYALPCPSQRGPAHVLR